MMYEKIYNLLIEGLHPFTKRVLKSPRGKADLVDIARVPTNPERNKYRSSGERAKKMASSHRLRHFLKTGNDPEERTTGKDKFKKSMQDSFEKNLKLKSNMDKFRVRKKQVIKNR